MKIPRKKTLKIRRIITGATHYHVQLELPDKKIVVQSTGWLSVTLQKPLHGRSERKVDIASFSNTWMLTYSRGQQSK